MTPDQKLKHAALELALKMPAYPQYAVQTLGLYQGQVPLRTSPSVVADAKVFYEYLKSKK